MKQFGITTHMMKKYFTFSLPILFLVTAIILSTGSLNAQQTVSLTATGTCADNPHFAGSFLQPNLGDQWTEAQWVTELDNMKQVCITQLIIQWTADSLHKTTIYPSKLDGYTQNTKQDVVGIALTQADKSGIDIYLGLQISDDWWNHYANDDTWLKNEAVIAEQVADELWSTYQQHPSLTGWYLSFEPDNFNFMAESSWQALSQFYAEVGQHLRSLSADKPIIIAPFYNVSGGQTPEAWQKMWTYILSHSQIDIVALQDGVGVGHATVSDLPAWFKATKDAVVASKTAAQLWVDSETFNLDNQPMGIQGIVADMKAVQPYVSNFVSFSFNHFLSPQQVNPLYYTAYSNYVLSNKLDTTAPSTPTHLIGKAEDATTIQLTWEASSDDAGTVGYEIYRNSKLVMTLYEDTASYTDAQLDPDTAYEYQVVAFDATGNKSKSSETSSATTLAGTTYATNLALNKAYETSLAADTNYVDTNGQELTDGVYAASTNFTDPAWQARNTDETYFFTIDLGSGIEFHEISSHWLQDFGPAIFLPEQVTYYASTDNQNFTPVGTVEKPAVDTSAVTKKYTVSGLNVTGRYVRIEVKTGNAAWYFLDEVEVRQ